MKKIILAAVTIITMMLCIAKPLFVHAAYNAIIGNDNDYTVHYTSLEDILNYYGNDVMYCYITSYSNSNYLTSCLIFDDAESIQTDVTVNNRHYDLYIENPTLNGTNAKSYYRDVGNGYISDLTESTLPLNCYYSYNSTGSYCKLPVVVNGNLSYYSSNRTNIDTTDFRIEPVIHQTIDVSFSPELSGVVTRSTVNDNGVSGLSNYFSMTVENNTSYGCQYRMMIKDTNGQPVTTYNQGESDTYYQPNWENGFSVNDDGSFVYINDEWIYVSPTIGGGVCKALKPSEWHYVAANDSITQNFSWSQFDFKKDHTYICMVYAVTNDLGCATSLDSSRIGLYNSYPDYCLDFTTQALVYQTVFTISNPATFNPNDNSFGNKIRNGNWSGDKGEFSAYENPSNGQLISGNGNVDELRNLPNSVVSGGSHGGVGYSTYHDATLNNIYGSGSYTSNRSFAQLNSYFGGYFGFLSAIIGFYPSPYQTLIMIGFAGLVVIGILKAAIK